MKHSVNLCFPPFFKIQVSEFRELSPVLGYFAN